MIDGHRAPLNGFSPDTRFDRGGTDASSSTGLAPASIRARAGSRIRALWNYPRGWRILLCLSAARLISNDGKG